MKNQNYILVKQNGKAIGIKPIPSQYNRFEYLRDILPKNIQKTKMITCVDYNEEIYRFASIHQGIISISLFNHSSDGMSDSEIVEKYEKILEDEKGEL